MNIPQSLSPAVEYFRRHVSQEMVSNERLIMITGAAIVLVILSLLYSMWSLTSGKSAELRSSKAALARLQAEVTEDTWPSRLEATQALKTQLGVRLWEAPTPGLAQAGFETWLRQRFGKSAAQLQQIQITRSPAVGRDGQSTPTLATLERMTAKVIAPFDQATMTQVLADAAQSDKLVIVDRLIVRAGANARVEMDISTFIRAADGANQAKP